MLVLSRQRGERIEIWLEDGRVIEVEVVDPRPDKVRVGVEAPKSVAVHRREVAEQIRRDLKLKAEFLIPKLRAAEEDPQERRLLDLHLERARAGDMAALLAVAEMARMLEQAPKAVVGGVPAGRA